ncbi:MAG: VanZ family protein [Candidatus Omnitrophota bacterium]|nr:VanZ family protein [Candidatus Omnitrophota bacterium]
MRKNINKTLSLWVLILLWMVLISALSSIPGRHLPRFGFFGFDKVAHMAEYFVLGFLMIKALFDSSKMALAKAVMICMLIAALYAGVDEWHQSFVPDRKADIADYIVDLIGLNIGIYIYIGSLKRKSEICR